MKAYAILEGGGVKGAALAGCLKAAEENNVEFVGYGGASAGSIIALLACVGFKSDELCRVMTEDVNFNEFLDDKGTLLENSKIILKKFQASSYLGKLWIYLRHYSKIANLQKNLGLYDANPLQDFLLRKIKEKCPNLKNEVDITFSDLQAQGFPPLKIIASDLMLRSPQVFSSGGGNAELNGSVIDAVRASISYPFVFRPFKLGRRYLVDGGLCSNLPVFLFEAERKHDNLPVIGFKLVAKHPNHQQNYDFLRFCRDMLATALESSTELQQKILEGVHYVEVQLPEGIDTLDFNLTTNDRQNLFNAGHSSTHSFFSKFLPQWIQAGSTVEQIQARHVPPGLITPLLQTIAKELENNTPARNVRVNIMLPTDRDTRIVVYHYGMEHDPDSDLELALDGGCSGKAWSTRQPQFADLELTRSTFDREWNMKRQQQNKVRQDRKAMLSLPLFDLRRSLGAQRVEDLNLIGTLSVDTNTSFNDTLWLSDKKEYIIESMKLWADIISRTIT